VRFLEIHETRAHALGGRLMRDLGDCVLLHAPRDRDPFFNRVAVVRWPEGGGAFDHRLAETLALFVGLDRQPHVWTSPAFGRPRDLAGRLVDCGFRDLGGGYVMLLVRPPASRAEPLPPGTTVERLRGGPGVTVREDAIRDIGRVLVESFRVDPRDREPIEAETFESLRSPALSVCLVRVDGEPVAVGKRYTFDGASYLSAIGTRPGHWGRGYGSIVTDALIRDSLADGVRYVYLGAFADNDRAIELYRRAGLEILGDRASDLLLSSGDHQVVGR
jgi:ribosomal protein S18 acetylase RimI-like enzyme